MFCIVYSQQHGTIYHLPFTEHVWAAARVTFLDSDELNTVFCCCGIPAFLMPSINVVNDLHIYLLSYFKGFVKQKFLLRET